MTDIEQKIEGMQVRIENLREQNQGLAEALLKMSNIVAEKAPEGVINCISDANSFAALATMFAWDLAAELGLPDERISEILNAAKLKVERHQATRIWERS